MSSRKLIINGSSSTNGGDFDKVSIRGEGTIYGDVNADVVNVYGQGNFRNNVSTKTMGVMGQTDINGSVVADFLKVYGQLDISKASNIKSLKIRGEVKSSQHLKGERIDNKGSLKVNGNVNCDHFFSQGECRIDGLLSAEEINIKLMIATSRITEMGGSKISVNRHNFPYGLSFRAKKAHLVTTIVEADDIYLEYTTAKIVRGNHVKIGPGCDIEMVEYRDSIRVSPGSTVHSEVNTSVKNIDAPPEIN
jgi:cytoskeletal protein CcmA (bactofilin family)